MKNFKLNLIVAGFLLGLVGCVQDSAQVNNVSPNESSLPSTPAATPSTTTSSKPSIPSNPGPTMNQDSSPQINPTEPVGETTTPESQTGRAILDSYKFKSIHRGFFMSCGINLDDSVSCWSSYENFWYASLSLTPLTAIRDKFIYPMKVPGLENIIQLATGWDKACALRNDGKVLCWGINNYGVVPTTVIPDAVHFPTPPTLIPNLSNVKQISVGRADNCAVLESGKVKCWGTVVRAGESLLGFTYPVELEGLSNIVQVELGHRLACSLDASGKVRCWKNYPIKTSDVRTLVPQNDIVKQISLRNTTLCALSVKGRVSCASSEGEFNSFELESLSNVKQITTGQEHACALLNNGNVYCWGNNQYGSLEDGLFNYSKVPVLIKGVRNVTSISAGNTATCALRSSGIPYCWGEEDSWGESAFNNKYSARPVKFSERKDILKLDLSSLYNGAVLSSSGELEIWGWNRFGVLGRGPFSGLSASPVKLDLPPIKDFVLSTWGLSCAILENTQETYCWGSTSYDLKNVVLPFKISQWDNAKKLSSSEFNVCALTEGAVSCLGINPQGSLGNLSTSTPAPVRGLSGKMTSIFSSRKGYGGHCGFSEEGKVFCWGYHHNTNFPHYVSGIPENSLDAVEVLNPFSGNIKFMEVGENISCLGEESGHFQCYGKLPGAIPNIRDGQMRQVTNHHVPNPSKLGVGVDHACVLKKDGSVWCWGFNLAGQIGNGSDETVETPVKINYPETIIDIDLQLRCTLAKGASGVWYTSGKCRRPL